MSEGEQVRMQECEMTANAQITLQRCRVDLSMTICTSIGCSGLIRPTPELCKALACLGDGRRRIQRKHCTFLLQLDTPAFSVLDDIYRRLWETYLLVQVSGLTVAQMCRGSLQDLGLDLEVVE